MFYWVYSSKFIYTSIYSIIIHEYNISPVDNNDDLPRDLESISMSAFAPKFDSDLLHDESNNKGTVLDKIKVSMNFQIGGKK